MFSKKVCEKRVEKHQRRKAPVVSAVFSTLRFSPVSSNQSSSTTANF